MKTKEYKLIIKQSYETFEIIVTTFAVPLLATSCSQDELPDDGGTEEMPVTFTAMVDYAIETQGDDTAENGAVEIQWGFIFQNP